MQPPSLYTHGNSKVIIDFQWIPEIQTYCADNNKDKVPIIIVGTQTNKRGLGETSVKREEGEQLAKRLSLAGYKECGIDKV